MRRAVPLLLVLVLVPSTAMASWYRCAYDGVARSACCCPTKDRTRYRAPQPEASLRSACCCTITQVGGAAPERTRSPISTDLATPPLALAVVAPAGAPCPRAAAPLARLRVHDPPDTLLARHCSLLL